MKRYGLILALLAVLLVLTACRNADKAVDTDELPLEPKEGVLIYAYLNPPDRLMRSYVNVFNRNHEDVQIEMRDYSGEEGVQRLLVELAAGRVPDIMDLHMDSKTVNIYHVSDMADDYYTDTGYWLPYRQMARQGYLEDLWPYIENDPDLGREGVLEAPLKAAEVDGGLYMLFKRVTVTTLIGAERVVGDRYGWTLEDLMETFAAMPEGSTILRYNAIRKNVFSNLLRFSLARFVNTETNQCSFDCEEFRNMLVFLNQFPEEFETPLSAESLDEELNWRVLNGRQMLEAVTVYKLDEIAYIDTFFTEPAAYVGYPTADGSFGSLFDIVGPSLAMSSTCQNKEAAWDFLRMQIRQMYSSGTMRSAIDKDIVYLPINKKDYELAKRIELKIKKEDHPWRQWFDSGPRFRIDQLTERDAQRLDTLIDNTTQIRIPDSELSDIVWETIGPFFAGDRSLDDTVQLLNNRVKLYLNEQM